MSVEIGDKAPDFTLLTDGGGELKLSSLRGKKVVLYFYPKDATPGCTTEAENFRDALGEFSRAETKIVGVLGNADQEISLLEKQLADLKQEKKALMQQLLTGKRRVKINNKECVA